MFCIIVLFFYEVPEIHVTQMHLMKICPSLECQIFNSIYFVYNAEINSKSCKHVPYNRRGFVGNNIIFKVFTVLIITSFVFWRRLLNLELSSAITVLDVTVTFYRFIYCGVLISRTRTT